MNNYCYIHIPFCNSKCKYCRFASFWITEELKINLYINKLLLEIKNKKIDFKNLKSIYFGWGTPSVLKINQLELIINTLRNEYWFDKNIEISIEATPDTIITENIKWWKKIWINRLSMWLQTLNNDSLIEIWRGNKGDVISALDNIQKEWFNNVSVDFIIGLPYVKKWEIVHNIDFLHSKYDFIKHISVYMLEEYYDVPEEKDSKFENIVYPNTWNDLWLKENDYLEEYISVKKRLKEYWFNSYEISNFSKIWYECKHNIAYWNHFNILAFWLWAHWFLNNQRYSNSEDFLEYYSWKNILKEELNNDDLFIENLMFKLRTTWLGMNIIDKIDQNRLKYFIDNDYLIKKSDNIILSDKWILVMDYIISEII